MRYLSFFRCTILMCGVLLLAGCPSIPTNIESEIDQKTAESSAQWKNYKKQLNAISHYQVRGSFGYISPQKNSSARVSWQQVNDNDYTLLLTTPFGGKVIEMTVRPDFARITNDKGDEYTNTDAEQLLYQLTNLTIPLNQMRSWLVGLPGDNSLYTLDGQYRLKQVILQSGSTQWRVNYKSFHTNLSPQLPKEIEIIQGDQKIKLKIDIWNLQ